MKLWSRPFEKRARRRGASEWRARRVWEVVSPAVGEIELSVFSLPLDFFPWCVEVWV